MKKKGGRLKRIGKISESSPNQTPVKTYAGMDRYSDAVMVEVGPNQESQFSIIRGYLKSWKKVFNSIDKEKKP